MTFLYSIGAKILAVISGVVLLFSGAHTALNSHPSVQTAAAVVAAQEVAQTSSGATSTATKSGVAATTTVVNQYITQPVIERTVVAPATNGYVTQSTFQSAIDSLTDKFGKIIYGTTYPAPATNYASGGVFNSISLSSKIDQLSGTKLTNITVSGVSGLAAADIPALSYLPISGGTLTGDVLLTNATSTNFFSTNASTTNATSTTLFATLGHFATGIIDSLTATAATITNLIATTITGTNATFTNATTTNATSTNSFATNFSATNATTTDLAVIGTGYFAGNVGVGTTSPFTNFAVNGSAYLVGNLNVGDAATTRSNLGLAYATNANIRNAEGILRIAAWGDSLTMGTYPATLSSLSGYTIFNGGVSGQTSTQIAARMLAATSQYSWPVIIWAGRNNFSSPSTVEADIASMVAALQSVGNNHYIILSVLNGPGEPSGSASYNNIISINTYLATTYGTHYLDVRTYLVQSGLSVSGIATSTQDQTDYANDVPENDLRADAVVHLNNSGYTVVANYIYGHFNILAQTIDNNVLTDQNIGSLLNPSFGYQQGGVTILTASTTNYAVSVGQYAGVSLLSTGIDNTSLGYQALTMATSSSDNTAIGYRALSSNTSGYANSALGSNTLYHNTTGYQNTAVGQSSMVTNTSGINNTASGYGSLYSNTTGYSNSAVGENALYSNTTGYSNSFVGLYSGYSNTGGIDNSGIGVSALRSNSTGNYNTVLGFQSGYSITTGTSNLVLGASVDVPNPTGNGQLNIGNVLYGINIYGGSSVSSSPVQAGAIGIGTTTPWAKLSVAGSAGGTIPVFTISTSTASATSTAFLVDQNGNVGIGTSTPTTALQVNGSITPNTDNVSTVGNATYRWNAVYATNNVIQTSDARLKENVTNLSYGLADILKLRPVSFTWIAQPQQGIKLGFIAQEVQPILPETVNTGDDANHTLGLTYTEFIPVIVNAIKEIASVTGAFRDSLIAWLGDATNGINKIFAHEIYGDKLCAKKSDGTYTCVTGDQLAAAVSGASSAATAAGSASSADTSSSTTPPVIEVIGNNPATVNVGDTYSDLGAKITGPTADLNLGIHTFVGTTPMEFAAIDTSAPATYHLYYVATDQNGLTSTSTRTVIVQAATSATTTSDTSTTTADASTTSQ